jgi:LAO/AO transport system kinase
MQDHALDDGVFIRSMATRGHLGGLALAVPEAVRVLDASGYAWVLVETVGVGQVEVDVAGQADTTLVVVTPGWGDAVQAAKAGLLEIADVFVVNKADRPGADQTERDLLGVLGMTSRGDDGWVTPVVRSVATAGEGVTDVVAAVRAHRASLESGGGLERRRRERVTAELLAILVARLLERISSLQDGDAFERASAAVFARATDPWTATDDLLEGS